MKESVNRCVGLFITFFKMGTVLFGGGISMLPLLKRTLVEKKQWMSEEEILDYFVVGQCTPGIIAVNVATFCGYKRAGITGSLAATLGIVCPSWIIITLIAASAAYYNELAWVPRALQGVYCAVAALLMYSIFHFSKKSIVDIGTAGIAAAAFTAITVFNVSGVFVVVFAAVTAHLIKQYKHKKQERDGQ